MVRMFVRALLGVAVCVTLPALVWAAPGYLGIIDAADGNTIGFFTPTPEPTSLVLIGTALIGLAVACRRRSR